MQKFHLAFPITDVYKAQEFYGDLLGFEIGRVSPKRSIIINFFDHQIVGHVEKLQEKPQSIYPRHFGMTFDDFSLWDNFRKRIEENNISYYSKPRVRFVGEKTEHHTFFIEDPFYNIMEFKYYLHKEAIFGMVNFEKVGDEDLKN